MNIKSMLLSSILLFNLPFALAQTTTTGTTENKVAVVDMHAILDNSPKMDTMRKGLEKQFAKEHDSIAAAQTELQTKAKKIDRKQQGSENLIDKFIEQEPRINKPKREEFFSPAKSAKESLIENDEIVTETLAKVYLEQGYYEKAIAGYEKLSWKYPQKSSFFASQIKLIYNLKEK